MKQEEIDKELSRHFSYLACNISCNNQLLYNDINKSNESFVMNILNIIEYGHFIDLNQQKHNYEGIDLLDKEQKIGIQVTVDDSSTKIKETLKKSEKYDLRVVFVFLSVNKPTRYNKNTFKDYPSFNKTTDVIYLPKLIEIAKMNGKSKELLQYAAEEIMYAQQKKEIPNVNDAYVANNNVKETIKNNNENLTQQKVINSDLLFNFDQLNEYIIKKVYNDDIKKMQFNELNSNMASVLDWFIGNRDFPVQDIELIYKHFDSSKMNVDGHVLKNRRNALIKYFTNNIDTSWRIYNLLYNKIITKKEYKIAKWLENDFLNDGERIIYTLESVNNKSYDNKYAIRIATNKERIYYPIIDKIEKDILSLSIEKTTNYKYKRKGTVIIGVGLETIINNLQRVVYNALLYGSIFRLLEARDIAAKVFMIYADMLDYSLFYKWGLRFYALTGNYDEYKKVSDKVSTKYREIESKEYINEVLNLKKAMTSYKYPYFDMFVYDKFGRLLNDSNYKRYEKKVLDLLGSDCIPYMNSAIKTIPNNIPKIKENDRLFDLLKAFTIKGGYYQVQNVIQYLNYDELNDRNKKIIKDIIKILIDTKTNIYITNLLIHIKVKEKIKDYDEILLNECSEDFLLFELNKTNRYPAKNLQIIINELSSRIDRCIKNGVITSYGVNYNIPANFFSNDSKLLRKIIDKNLLPLCEKSLSLNKVEHKEKIKLLRSLMYIYYFDNSYKEAIKKIIDNTTEECSSDIYSAADVNSINVYLLLFDYIFGSINFVTLIKKYIIISDSEYRFEEIRIILDYVFEKEEKTDLEYNLLSILITSNLMSDNESNRSLSIKLSKHLYNTIYFNDLYEILIAKSYDSSYEEMRAIIYLVSDISDDEKIKTIKNNLLNNGNYNIKYMAEKYINIEKKK